VKIASLGDIEYDAANTDPFQPAHITATHGRRYSTPIPTRARRTGIVTYTAHHPSDHSTPTSNHQAESHSRKTREVIDRLNSRNEVIHKCESVLTEIHTKYDKIDDNINKVKQVHIAVLCTLTTVIAIFIAYQAIKGHYS
jgi:hypothetical protein